MEDVLICEADVFVEVQIAKDRRGDGCGSIMLCNVKTARLNVR
jgi:hypothetical protein